MLKDYVWIYLLKRKELLLLRLHDAGGDMMALETLLKLCLGEGIAILSRVGLPSVQGSPSQLSRCV